MLRLKSTAQSFPGTQFNNLMCHLKVENLRRSFHSLSPKKAVGIDGITKAMYAKNLEANLLQLQAKLHQMSYKPKATRLIFIPKVSGEPRPIAVSSFEDKIVQKAVADILELLYEPLFLPNSFGFRPQAGAHKALRSNYLLLKDKTDSWIVDVDLEKFFDSIAHDKLMELLRLKISDSRFLRLIYRLLTANLQDQRGIHRNRKGTPQGSVVSPILANIYLHYVLDEWFLKRFAGPQSFMLRYADDVIFRFNSEEKAKAFLDALKGRLEQVQLRINETKTKLVNFSPDQHQCFHSLGIRFYWAKDKKKNPLLKVKTQTERFRKAILDYKTWIKSMRNRINLNKIWKRTAEKLNGHYAYYGLTFNSKVSHFYKITTGLLYKWLNRRSQKISMTSNSFLSKLKRSPLPKPYYKDLFNLKQGIFSYAI